MVRNPLIDRLKGYACFLVLFGHVIMGVRNAGIDIPAFFESAEIFIWSFHVSLFLFLSGAVYNITGGWKSKGTRGSFIKHKLITLGVPYVIFTVVYVLINSLSGGANTEFSVNDILYIWKTPVAQYWFLYALFFLFVMWAVSPFDNLQTTLIVVLICYGVPALGGSFGFFDFVMYSALAFGLGTFVPILPFEKIPSPIKILIVILHFVTVSVLIKFGVAEVALIKELIMVLGIISSILLISEIQKLSLVSRFLDFMNKYSFQTYLLHTIFTAGVRIVLMRFGVMNWVLHVIAGTLAGLFFSVFAAKIAKKVKILNACFFPSVLMKK